MKNSNQNSKSDKKRDFGGRGFGGRSQMYDAICAECGQKCEVPFRPTGDKPVYCTVCFAKRQGGQPRRSEARDFRRPQFRDNKMYSAICDKCGKQCQVPFQPTPGKPIYCAQCFGKGSDRGVAPKSDQLASINAKLDKIINALVVAKLIKPNVEEKAKPAKVAPVKEVKKKVVAKKVAAKKNTKKKK